MGWGIAALLYSLGAHAPTVLVVGALAIGAFFTAFFVLGLPLLLFALTPDEHPSTKAEVAEWERKHPWAKQYRHWGWPPLY
jgi:hypothetical protein